MATLAEPRSRAAVAVSSACSDVMPRFSNCSARVKACSVSFSVVLDSITLASADLTEASARSTCAESRIVSSSASTSPFLTRWFSTTATERMTPDNSLEISTWISGCSVPVAETSTVMSPVFAGAVR